MDLDINQLSQRARGALGDYMCSHVGDSWHLEKYSIEEITNNVKIENLQGIRNCGPKTIAEIALWLGGEPPPPRTKRRTKMFRCFGKTIRITISIN